MTVIYTARTPALPDHFTGVVIPPWIQFVAYVDGIRVGAYDTLDQAKAMVRNLGDTVSEDDE